MTGSSGDCLARKAAVHRLKAKRKFRSFFGTAIAISAFVTVVWAATGTEYFWPIWVMLGLAVSLAVTAWQAYGPAERPITEQEIQQELHK